tara:strand:+ start:1541 stop:1813 length:273 start_codon:yes stop_codon:yes gene_type:complete
MRGPDKEAESLVLFRPLRHQFGDDAPDVSTGEAATHSRAHAGIVVSAYDDLVMPHEDGATIEHVVENTGPDEIYISKKPKRLSQFLDDAA